MKGRRERFEGRLRKPLMLALQWGNNIASLANRLMIKIYRCNGGWQELSELNKEHICSCSSGLSLITHIKPIHSHINMMKVCLCSYAVWGFMLQVMRQMAWENARIEEELSFKLTPTNWNLTQLVLQSSNVRLGDVNFTFIFNNVSKLHKGILCSQRLLFSSCLLCAVIKYEHFASCCCTLGSLNASSWKNIQLGAEKCPKPFAFYFSYCPIK